MPQRFRETRIPFELVFAERKYIMVYYENEILSNADVLVTSHNGEQKNYKTDEHGWIQSLPNRDICEGFTAAEFKVAQVDGWKNQYQYKIGKKKVYMIPSAAESQGYERVNKYPKITKYSKTKSDL